MREGRIASIHDKGYLLLQGEPGDGTFQQAVIQSFGCAPPPPRRAATQGNAAILWLTPREWLVELPVAEAEPAQQALTARLIGTLAAVTDISDSFAVFDLSEPGAADALSCGCSLDLSPRAFSPGSVARCGVAQVPAVLWKADSQRFRCLVDRSFSLYFRDWLASSPETW